LHLKLSAIPAAALFCVFAVLSLPGSARALNDLYWDTNGTAEGTGPLAGIWGTSNFWNSDPLGIADTFQITTTAANDLHFSAGVEGPAGTITVSGNQFANGLYFEESVVVLSGGSITLSDGAIINNSAGDTVFPRISSALVSSGTVTLTGTRLWLHNPSFAGGGTLNVNTSNATLLENSGALNGLATINILSGGLDIRQNNGGGTNYNYAAGTTLNFVNSASLIMNLTQSVNWLGDITVAAGRTGTLQSFQSGSILTVSGNISGAGSLDARGNGGTHLTGVNTYAGGTSINATTLRVSGGSALPDGTVVTMSGSAANMLDVQSSETIGALASGTAAFSVVNIANGQTLTLGSGTQTFNGTFSGGGKLAVAGAMQTLSSAVTLAEAAISSGRLTLTADTTITNGVTLTGGALWGGTQRGTSLTLTPALTVLAGQRAALSAVSTGGSSGTATVSFGGTLTINSGGVLQLVTPGSNAAYGTANGALVFGAGAVSGTKFQLNGNSFTVAGLGTNGGGAGTPAVENGATAATTLTVALAAGATDVYAGTLRNGGTGTLSLTVNGGAGSSLTLAGANTHTGNTTVTGGNLVLAHTLALQNSTVTTGGTGLLFDDAEASHTFRVGGLTGSNGLALVDNGGNAVTLSVGGANATQTYTGALSGTGGLTKTGTAQFSLGGTNTYTGATTVNGGELRTDFSIAGSPQYNIIDASSALVLGGGMYTERQLTNTRPNGQTFNGMTVKAGSSVVNQIRGGGGVLLLTLGSVSRETGGTVAFSANGGGASGLAATGTNTASGIIGGWATYLTTNGGATHTNATDWAAYNDGKIVALGAGAYTNTAATTASTNLNLTSNVTLNANATVGSVRFNDATANPTLTLNGSHAVDGGGILVTGNVGANATRITGGSITSGNGQDLIIIQNNTNAAGALTVDATITGAVGLTKSGGGQLILAGANDYTGATYLNNGITSISSNANLGSVSTGAAVHLNGGTLSATATVALDNGGANARAVVLGNNGGTLDVAAGQTLTVNGALSGEGNLTKSGAGALVLSGSSTQTGGTTVTAGLVQVGVGGSGQTGTGAVTLNGAGAVLAGTGVVGGATTVSSGVIRPGDAAGTVVGTLTVGDLFFTPATSTTVAEFQITGSAGAGTLASDKLVINGALTLNGNSNIVVDGSGYTPTLGDSFVLLDWSTVLDTGTATTFNTGTGHRTGANIGNEGNLDLPDLSSFGLGWDVLNFSGSGSLTIVVVPEPGRMLLVLVGLVVLGGRRQRRRGER